MTESEDSELSSLLATMRAPQEDIGALLLRAKVLRSLVDVEEELPRVLRYEILQVLGVGGMGSVFLAFDPRLERKVALKVVRMEKGAQSARVLREAKALALLSHPNVVSVFDAEPTSDGLCISMEYLVGPTLRTWMKEEERPWQQTVEKLIEAGRGLQAAHEAKLVHGDFKPENVVFDSSEKAVVVDFGLARREQGTDVPLPTAQISLPSLDEVATTTGIAGTIAYFSPELLRGHRPDAHSDQFSFALCVFEALVGTAPFHRGNFSEFSHALLHEDIPTAADTGIPLRVHQLLAKALQKDPGKRFPRLEDLLDSLQGLLPRRGRRVWPLMAAAGISGAVLAIALLILSPDSESGLTEVRAKASEEVEAVWNPEVASRLRAEVLREESSPLEFRVQMLERVVLRFNDYRNDWQTARIEAWQKHREGTRSKEHLAREKHCLGGLLVELDALIARSTLNEAPLPVATLIVAAQYLSQPSSCDHIAKSGRGNAPIVGATTNGDAFASGLAELRTLLRAGLYEEAETRAAKFVAGEVEIGEPSTEAQLHLIIGQVKLRLAKKEEAVESLREAVRWAAEAHNGRIAAEVWITLVSLGRDSKEGAAWADAAQAAVVSLGDDPEIHADLAAALGALYFEQARYEESRQAFTRAIEIRESQRGLQMLAAVARADLTHSLIKLESFSEASVNAQRALDTLSGVLGESHPLVGGAYNTRGVAAIQSGDLDAGLEDFGRSHEILLAAYGELHPRVVLSLGNLGNLHRERGEEDKAESTFREALSLANRLPEGQTAKTDNIHNNLAVLLYRQDRLSEAEEHAAKALELRLARYGDKHDRVASSRNTLADILADQGKYEEALIEFRAVLKTYAAVLGESHTRYALAKAGLADVVRRQGRLEVARNEFEEALSILAKDNAPADVVAYAEFGMALTLWELGRESRAKDSAKVARDLYRSVANASDDLAKVEAWLRAHP